MTPPLDRDALLAVQRPFGESALLPAAAYLDPAVFAWEMRELFDGGWVCAGRVPDAAEPWTQRAVAVGSTSVLVTRDEALRLRAFANVCRHRGHELLACDASSGRGIVQCPYHAWSYELDGSLRVAPHTGDDLRRDELGLTVVGVEQWAGWLFVNVDAVAPAFADHAGALPALLAPWQCEDLVVGARHTYEVAANWKLICENYHECYHCPFIHPELCRVTVPTSGDNVRDLPGAFIGGTMDLADTAATMSLSGAAVGTVRPCLDARRRHQVLYLQLFPDLLVSVHPDYVMTHRLRPLGSARTSIECEWLFARDDVARAGFDPGDATALWDITNRQDWAAVESVQRGIASPTYRPGVLAGDEDAVYQFLVMMAGAYLGGSLERGRLPEEFAR